MSTPANRPGAGPVWAKRVGAAFDENVAFCAGRDVVARPPCDEALQPHDLATNAAHVLMLAEAGVLPREDEGALLGALVALRGRDLAGENLVRPQAEDVHMSVELAAGEIAGDAAGRMHSGRSRNDQVATDMALWLRERVAAQAADVVLLARVVARRAREESATPVPGLTHQQPAMVTTYGHWLASYLPRLARVLSQWRASLRELEECPLGAAAGFGTSWPIRRDRTAELLGFERASASTMDTVWRRGEAEARHAFILSQLLSSLSGIGEDLMLLSSPPRRWVALDDAHVTGSSIMPQKRNPDFAEVTRAKAAVVSGIAQSLLGITGRAVAGYNRQSQWTKYLVMDADGEAAGAASLFAGALEGMRVDRAAMRAACEEGFLNAADCADHIARTRGVPFRATYRILGAAVRASEALGTLDFDHLDAALAAEGLAPLSAEERASLSSPEALLQLRRQPGGPRPEDVLASIDAVMAAITEDAAAIEAAASAWRARIEALWALARGRASGSTASPL